MIVLPHSTTQRIVISPGEFYVSNQGEIISTLLGSCVSACLYDPIKNVIGMNHFLLAYSRQYSLRPVIESDAGRYWLYAIELLINEMMKKGADRLNLKAKCFGGANVLSVIAANDNKPTVGDMNVLFIKAFLQKEHIPIVSACLGGNIARMVHFIGNDYTVLVKRINQQQQIDVEKQEYRFWKQRVDEAKNTNFPEFW